MDSMRLKKQGGFSLIELVIVVVIIGIIGAIAIPRLSRGAEGASDSALAGDLAVMRGAIDHYAAEHRGAYPSLSGIAEQLTQYTDASGNTSAIRTGAYIYGPYLRTVPAVPVGPFAGQAGFTDSAGDPSAGWEYDQDTGEIIPNTVSSQDASGTLYSDY